MMMAINDPAPIRPMRRPSLSVLSFNVRGIPFTSTRPRAAAYSHLIERMDIDVVSFQEVHTYTLQRKLAAGLPSLPYLSAARGLYGPAGGVATFSRKPVANRWFTPLGTLAAAITRPSNFAAQARSLHKGILVTELADGLSIVNVHLSANSAGDWSPRNRMSRIHDHELEVLHEVVAIAQEGGRPCVVTGDFNFPRSSSWYECVAHATGLRDVHCDAGRPTFHREHLKAGREPKCIDYIFAPDPAEGWEVCEARLELDRPVRLRDASTRHLSDHAALLARFNHRPAPTRSASGWARTFR